MDYDIPKYENKIAEESRIYSIYLDSKELAHYIMLHKKYAPKEEYKKLDLDIMYETIIGGYFEYTEREKDKIKQKALIITRNQKHKKIKYKILKSLIKDNNYTYQNIAEYLNYSINEFMDIINNFKELTYKDAVLLSKFFHMTPDDLFYSEYVKSYKQFFTKIKKREKQDLAS